MSAALRYSSEPAGAPPLALEVPGGGVSRVRLPDAQTKARFIAAVAEARCEPHEELELLGEPVKRLKERERARLLGRVGVLSPAVTLISTLNAWENIELAAAYHGSPPRERVAEITLEVLGRFVDEPLALLARLPHQLSALHRRLVAFVRLLVRAPELAVMDGLEEGLSREECACVARFEAEYRARQPSGTLLYVDIGEEQA